MLQTSSTDSASGLLAPQHDTSAQALNNIGLRQLKGELDKIHDIVLAAARHGVEDMSGREIQQRYELIYGKRIDSGTVSARCNGLIAARRLQRCTFARPCMVTGNDIHPVKVMAQQTRLVG
jgi:hypothetical protein